MIEFVIYVLKMVLLCFMREEEPIPLQQDSVGKGGFRGRDVARNVSPRTATCTIRVRQGDRNRSASMGWDALGLLPLRSLFLGVQKEDTTYDIPS
jgi:hypothetical protein